MNIAFWKPNLWPHNLIVQLIGTVLTTLVGHLLGIISENYGKIQLVGLEEKMFKWKSWLTTHNDRLRLVTIAHTDHVVLEGT